MNKEIFRVLKEINSLLNKSRELKTQIQTEKSRLEKIDSQIKHKQEKKDSITLEFQQLKSTLSTKEAQLYDATKQNESGSTNLNKAISQKEIDAAEAQLKSSQQQIDLLNDEILTLMEQEEAIENELQELDQFLEGVRSGRKEIEDDILSLNSPREKDLDSFEARILNLFELIPAPHAEHFKKLVSKDLPRGPISRLNSQNFCELCGTQADSTKVKAVEEKLEYKTCSGCGRVLIPESSQYL